MDAQKLKAVLEKHALWLANKEGGERANLSRANLTGANLAGADLTEANLTKANLTEANLTRANLYGANLTEANLTRANLYGANLSRADLAETNLAGADLTEANLTEANLTKANLTEANLTGADLSGAKGLLDPATWLEQFEHDNNGLIVYKAIGDTTFTAPSHWNSMPGSVLTEVCNPLRTLDCACGVNFGTLAWVRHTYPGSDIWRCRIAWRDLAGVVVPYHTHGKARCTKLTLLEIVS